MTARLYQYGNMPEQNCQLCGQVRTRFGCLLDPNGHIWRICADCINGLWHSNQQIIRAEEIEDRAQELVKETFAKLIRGES